MKNEAMPTINKIIINCIIDVFITLLLSLTFIVCTDIHVTAATPKYQQVITDYSKPEHWLSLPSSITKKVDIFYIYPTAWKNNPAIHNVTNEPHICTIDNPSMLAGAKTALRTQATAFEAVGNIYSPYYRQADGAYVMTLGSWEKQDEFVGGIPKLDVFAAFDYYIKHYNNGRPFILASHSQGSVIMRFLLAEYMKQHPAVYSRMIASYAIGISITKDYLAKNPHLKFAEGPDDTGVIISYNTQADKIAGINPLIFQGAIAINPITWTREETPAAAEQSLGSKLDFNGTLVDKFKYAGARVNKKRGILICDVDPATLPKSHWPKGIYHYFDYGLYYYNIRENAANRATKFLKIKRRERIVLP